MASPRLTGKGATVERSSPPRLSIREQHRNAYPIDYGLKWGEAAWTATDLVHKPGSLNLICRNMARITAAFSR